jgi:hypothetical protein
MNEIVEDFRIKCSLSDADRVISKLLKRWPHVEYAGNYVLPLMIQSKGKIAGSFIIDCIMDTNYADDVDIFLPMSSMHLWPMLNPKKAIYNNLPGHYLTDRDEPFNFIFCNDVDQCIDSFDLDLCKANFDGVSIRAGSMEQFRTKTMYLSLCSTSNMSRIDKYAKRGFTIVIAPLVRS